MVEERDFVAVSVPFCIGISTSFTVAGSVPAAAAAGAAVLVAVLSCRRARRFPAIHVAVMLFTAGVLCGVVSELSALRPGAGAIGAAAEESCKAFKALIARIGFSRPQTGAMLTALLTGDRSGLSPDVVAAFRASGASHILALSGLHLGVIYLILRRGLSILGNSIAARRIRYSLLIILSAFYTLMAGAGPSIVRAFLFIFLGETATLLNRRRSPVRILLAALTIQLALSPDSIKSVGFQLSYLAMCGIVFLFPKISAIYNERGPIKKIWDIVSLSVSCQVFTAPLSWFYFRSFPKFFLLTNLLTMPLTSLVMAVSILTIGLYAIGACPDFLISLTDGLVGIIIKVLGIISRM